MSRRFVLAIALAFGLGAAVPAAAGSYVCNLPRALLCENCARDLTITLTHGGACRVSFTAGASAAPDASRMTFRFAVLTPVARTWRPRVVTRSAPLAAPVSGRCFVFNGAQYCE
jgi:hypothetical protein